VNRKNTTERLSITWETKSFCRTKGAIGNEGPKKGNLGEETRDKDISSVGREYGKQQKKKKRGRGGRRGRGQRKSALL